MATERGRRRNAPRALDQHISRLRLKLGEAEAGSDELAAAALLQDLGFAWARRGNRGEALSAYERAAAIVTRTGRSDRIALGLNHLGGFLESLGRYREAARTLRRALDAAREAADRSTIATSLNNLGLVNEATGHPRRALALYEAAVSLLDQAEHRDKLAATLTNMGVAHERLGNLDKALDLHQAALAMQVAIKDVAGEASTRCNMGVALNRARQHARALAEYEQALVLRRRLGDRPETAKLLFNIGLTCKDLGRIDAARDRLRRALHIQEEIDDPRGAASTWEALGDLQAGSHQLPDAMASYESALKLWRAIGDRQREACALQQLGALSDRMGNGDHALDLLASALNIHEGSRSKPVDVASTLDAIARVHSRNERHAQALDYATRALRVWEKIGSPRRLAATLEEVGLIHSALGRHDAAIAMCEQALSLRESDLGNPNRHALATSFWKVGGVCLGAGEFAKAVDYLTRALPHMEDVGHAAGVAGVLDELGEAYAALGRAEEARSCLERALGCFASLGDQQREAGVLERLADSHQASGRIAEAMSALRRLIELDRSARPDRLREDKASLASLEALFGADQGSPPGGGSVP